MARRPTQANFRTAGEYLTAGQHPDKQLHLNRSGTPAKAGIYLATFRAAEKLGDRLPVKLGVTADVHEQRLVFKSAASNAS